MQDSAVAKKFLHYKPVGTGRQGMPRSRRNGPGDSRTVMPEELECLIKERRRRTGKAEGSSCGGQGSVWTVASGK